MKPTVLVVLGDSAASGVGDSDQDGKFYGWGHHLAEAFNENINYLNLARPGAQSAEVFQKQLPSALSQSPDIVAVIVGGNDILRNGFSPKKFEENLRATLLEIEQAGAISMLLELHDPTKIIPMPTLLKRVCRKRVNSVNAVTLKLGLRFGSIIISPRKIPDVYAAEKWHIDKMHPSRQGHQHLAQAFAEELRIRGFNVGDVKISAENNRNRRDSFIWLLKNGTPWFLKRSFDLLPSLMLLMAVEFVTSFNFFAEPEQAEIIAPDFKKTKFLHANHFDKVRVS